jgi:hypothetical protein
MTPWKSGLTYTVIRRRGLLLLLVVASVAVAFGAVSITTMATGGTGTRGSRRAALSAHVVGTTTTTPVPTTTTMPEPTTTTTSAPPVTTTTVLSPTAECVKSGGANLPNLVGMTQTEVIAALAGDDNPGAATLDVDPATSNDNAAPDATATVVDMSPPAGSCTSTGEYGFGFTITWSSVTTATTTTTTDPWPHPPCPPNARLVPLNNLAVADPAYGVSYWEPALGSEVATNFCTYLGASGDALAG